MTDDSERLERIATRMVEQAIADEDWRDGDRVVVVTRRPREGGISGAGASLGYAEDEDGAVELVNDIMDHGKRVADAIGVRVHIHRVDLN